MPCSHPLASLKPETATQDKGQVVIKFACTDCLARVTKAFMIATPEPLAHVEEGIADLLPEPDPPAKVHPWRRFSPVTP